MVRKTPCVNGRKETRGQVFESRVSKLFYTCWPGCYRGHKRWYCDLAGVKQSYYYHLIEGVKGVSRSRFHTLNLLEAMLDQLGPDVVRRLGPGFRLGNSEYEPSPGCFASGRRQSRVGDNT